MEKWNSRVISRWRGKDKGETLQSLVLQLMPRSELPPEKKFLEVFHIGRRTFINTLGCLRRAKYLDYESHFKPVRRFLSKGQMDSLRKVAGELKTARQRPWLQKDLRHFQDFRVKWQIEERDNPSADFNLFFVMWLCRESGMYLFDEIKITKSGRLYVDARGRKIRDIRLKQKEGTIQIPFGILTRKDLTIAERLIAIERCRFKKRKRHVKIKDLVKETGFSKVTVIKALRKL